MSEPNPPETVLRVQDLVTTFATDQGVIRPVDGVSFELARGRTLAIVGESGCGKSVTALSIMRLIPESNGRIESGSISFEGQDVLALSKREMRSFRGNRAAMVFQEPMTALNPVHTVGKQVSEAFRLHQGKSKGEAWDEAVRMLDTVKIPDPAARARNYPHELSGGMRQRVMIAMALACNPALLIADEPTTALDVTIQAQVLRLMQTLQEELGTAMLFITHDLGVVAEVADEVAVMYAGRIVEHASAAEIYREPLHPYTRGLMSALPRLDGDRSAPLTTIDGIVPALSDLPKGCRFAARCPLVEDVCREQIPDLIELRVGDHTRKLACHVTSREVSA
ncbi:MAG: ABC transporter ATP-binding protein [Myxococcales bacterium]|nr:ABC transporter ATP-binding protein [Myxococcales bacterium]